MFRYFRTLFFLMVFFLEDSFLIYVGRVKDNYYYPIATAYRQILKNHFCEPFKATHIVEIPPEYAESFKDIILNQKLPRIPKDVIYKELDQWLWKHYRLTLKHIRYGNNGILSFTYTY